MKEIFKRLVGADVPFCRKDFLLFRVMKVLHTHSVSKQNLNTPKFYKLTSHWLKHNPCIGECQSRK